MPADNHQPNSAAPHPKARPDFASRAVAGIRAALGGVDWHSRRTRAGLSIVAVALLAVATTLIVVGLNGQQNAPQPPAAAASPLTVTPAPQPASTSMPTPTPTPTAAATPALPFRLTIPAINVNSILMKLGRNRDGTVQVPPLNDVKQAGWYRYSPVPGDTGPAIILGHIDSAQAGNGVFFNLGKLHQGDRVTVLRTDHLLETFTITRVIRTAKTAFPASAVYGNTVDPELRLITCGGRFDPAARSYEDNIIAFAALTSTRTSDSDAPATTSR